MFFTAGIVIILLLTQTWYGERLAVFLTGDDTFGYGWYRHVAGLVFQEAGIFHGCDGLAIGAFSGTEILSRFSNSKLLLLLYEYGWAAVILLLLIYCVCLGALAIMAMRIWKCKSANDFSKYGSFFAVCVLFIQSFLGLAGFLFLDSGIIDMPLLSGNVWATGVDCLLIMAVVRLYIRQEKRPD